MYLRIKDNKYLQIIVVGKNAVSKIENWLTFASFNDPILVKNFHTFEWDDKMIMHIIIK
jgi:hypothetical protein